MSTIDDIGTRLQGQGVGTVGTDIFLGQAPDDVDELVAVLPTSGLEPIRTMGVPNLVLRPSAQVMARSKTSAVARAKAEAAWAALHGFGGTLNSTAYQDIAAQESEPFRLPQDKNDRHRYVFNVQVHRSA